MSKRWLPVILALVWLIFTDQVMVLSQEDPTTPAAASLNLIDLSQIGEFAPKGRVQDKQYNPDVPVVDALIEAGPSAIPFLVSKLDDETEIQSHVFAYCGTVCVGDVAFRILSDFFTTSDWRHFTVHGFCFDQIEDRHKLRQEIEDLLKPYEGHLVWNSQMRCFFPENTDLREIFHLEERPCNSRQWTWPEDIKVEKIWEPSQGSGDYMAIIEVDKRNRIVKEGQQFEGLEVAVLDGQRRCILLRTTELEEQEEREFCSQKEDNP